MVYEHVIALPIVALQTLDRIRLHYARNANERKTETKRTENGTNASHERHEKCTIYETNARYTKQTHDARNERTIHEANARYTKQTNDTRNERTIHE